MRSVLDPPWPALRSLALALDGAGIEWRLGGSALVSAMGLTDEVGDLDVTVATGVLHEVQRACAPWLVGTSLGDAPEPWCSDWLVSLRIGDTDVDVIGGFAVRGPTGEVAIPQDLGGHLDVDGVVVPLADPAVWWWIYRMYRPERAAQLAEVLDGAALAAVERRLGPAGVGTDGQVPVPRGCLGSAQPRRSTMRVEGLTDQDIETEVTGSRSQPATTNDGDAVDAADGDASDSSDGDASDSSDGDASDSSDGDASDSSDGDASDADGADADAHDA